MDRKQAVREIAESSFRDILKRFPFWESYKSKLERVNNIDITPIFSFIGNIFSFVVSVVWFIIVTVTYPVIYLPSSFYYWRKAKRMNNKNTE